MNTKTKDHITGSNDPLNFFEMICSDSPNPYVCCTLKKNSDGTTLYSIVYANAAFAGFTNRSILELKDKDLLELATIDEKNHEILKQCCDQVIKVNCTKTVEMLWNRWSKITIQSIDELLLLSFIDISNEKSLECKLKDLKEQINQTVVTHNKNMDLVLKENELNLALLNKVGELAQIGGWEINLLEDRLRWSDEVFKIHDVPFDQQPTVDEAIKFYDDDSIHIIQEAVDQAIKHGANYDVELGIITKSGKLKNVRACGDITKNEQNEIVSVYGSFQDITKIKKMRDEMTENLVFIEALVNMSPDLLYIYDLIEQKNVYANDGIKRILGYSTSDLKKMGTTMIKGLMHPDDFQNYTSNVFPLYSELKKGHELCHHYRMKHKNGEWRTLKSIETSYKQDSNKKTTQIFGVIHDITSEKRTEKDLLMAKEMAEKANVAKGQFLANMSHEIRTPMNGLIGTLQLLEMTELSDVQKEYLKVTQMSSNALLDVINDILDYSKLEAGKILLENNVFNLREVIKDTVTLFKTSADNKGLVIDVIVDHLVPESMIGDAFRLRQVISNLLGNALKFTKEGDVKISVHVLENDVSDHIKLKFDIKDSGIGIRSNKLEYLFNSFSQVDASNTRSYGGTGLGLAICKGLVEKMGGEIWVESRKHEGSTFSFTCELIKTDFIAKRNIVVTESEDDSNSNLSVLIVEDDPTSRLIIEHFSKKKEWQVKLADNGQMAVELYKQHQFDVVLMDVQMPIMNGYTATGLIREHEIQSGTRTPIISMTAYALKGDKEKCLESGMDDYISKPIKAKDLYNTVRKWT